MRMLAPRVGPSSRGAWEAGPKGRRGLDSAGKRRRRLLSLNPLPTPDTTTTSFTAASLQTTESFASWGSSGMSTQQAGPSSDDLGKEPALSIPSAEAIKARMATPAV